jgi:head-tail adaptor
MSIFARTVLGPKPQLSSGQRDKEVRIESLTSSVAGTRYPVETWGTLVELEWMARTELRANERFTADQQTVSTETQWEMDYRADMDPDLLNVPKTRRLVYSGRTYDIVAASVIEPKRGIELLTVARVQG